MSRQDKKQIEFMEADSRRLKGQKKELEEKLVQKEAEINNLEKEIES